jgi:hypothetical protein
VAQKAVPDLGIDRRVFDRGIGLGSLGASATRSPSASVKRASIAAVGCGATSIIAAKRPLRQEKRIQRGIVSSPMTIRRPMASGTECEFHPAKMITVL